MSLWKFGWVAVAGVLLAGCEKEDAAESYERETRQLEAELDADGIRTADDLEAAERKIYDELVKAYIDGGETAAGAKGKARRDFLEEGRTPPVD